MSFYTIYLSFSTAILTARLPHLRHGMNLICNKSDWVKNSHFKTIQKASDEQHKLESAKIQIVDVSAKKKIIAHHFSSACIFNPFINSSETKFIFCCFVGLFFVSFFYFFLTTPTFPLCDNTSTIVSYISRAGKDSNDSAWIEAEGGCKLSHRLN